MEYVYTVIVSVDSKIKAIKLLERLGNIIAYS